MKLVIISHTEHYISSNGEVVGWGPTIREIDHLTQIFEFVYHCAPLHKDKAPPSALPYKMKESVRFVPISPSGGRSVWAKLGVLKTAPANLKIVWNILKEGDIYQFRAPTGIGVYMIPWLKWFSRKPGWFKYAGNWMQENPPIGYRFQRLLLKHLSNNIVTINGAWPKQEKHCVTFENPCLTQDEIEFGHEELKNKRFDGKLNFAFVGRLEEAKGVGRILKAFGMLDDYSRIGTIHFIGDGPGRREYFEKGRELPLNIIFHGFLDRKQVGEVLNKCHVLLLPSNASEGFPKVIAEAVNYGCIPVVSDVSSIGQYIYNGDNGFVLNHKDISGYSLYKSLTRLLEDQQLKEYAFRANQMSEKFSFNYYLERIKQEIIKPLGLNKNDT